MAREKPDTPWRRAAKKIGVSNSELARLLNRHRSKISRCLADPDGLISGPDQRALQKVAREVGVTLRADDLVPNG